MDKKKTKKKGPIRIEAIVPITVIIILFAVYFRFYFDSHLRKGLEYGATQAHGAEVNIGKLRTDFLAPAISISNIQVTDKGNPELNIVRIGEVRLKLLWDGLLRGKFVIPESSILQIQTNSKRSRPGYIVPEEASSSKAKSKVEIAANQTIDQLKQKNDANLLGDIFSVVGGTDYKDQLKKLESEIKSKEKIETLEKELKAKEKEWKKRIDELPDESEIKQLVKKVETLKIDTSSPKKIDESFKKVDAIYKEARAKYKNIEEAKKVLGADLKKYENEYKGLEKMVQKDIDDLGKKLNIPSLDPAEINKMLLGNLVANQLGSLYKYKAAAEKYMPSKTKDERKADKQSMTLDPKERSKGMDFRFPKAKSYPKFWLQKAQISSDSKKGEAGDVTGTLQNVTNNPRHLGKPATLDFIGGFPHQNIFDVTGKITVDHTTDTPFEQGSITVGRFPVKGNTLSKSKDVELAYQEADGSSIINFLMKDQTLSLDSKSLFKDVVYTVGATDKNVKRLLDGVVSKLKELDLNIRAKGSWEDLSLHINSNLGQKLANAIQSQLAGEVNKARKDIENHVQGLISKEQNKLQGQLSGIEKELGVSLKSREDAVKSIEGAIDKKKKEATEKEKKKLEKDVKKEVNKLLKGIKF